MKDYRKTAIVTGALFILATVASLISYLIILDPILTAPDYLLRVSENRDLVVTGALFELVNNFAIVAISLVLYPVLRLHSVVLALAYVAARIMESVLITIGDLSVLALASLGQSLQGHGEQTVEIYEVVGGVLHTVVDWTFLLGPGLVLAITALILNYVLLRTGLVPKFLAIWGLVGAASLAAGDMFAIYGYDQVLLFAAPFGLQEMVFALWLIVKGFDASVLSGLQKLDLRH